MLLHVRELGYPIFFSPSLASMALLSSDRLLMALFLLLSNVAHAIDSMSTDNNTYGASSDTPWQTYLSAPSLKPPELLITKAEQGLADGLVFLGVLGEPSSTQNVPCIFGETDHYPFTFRALTNTM